MCSVVNLDGTGATKFMVYCVVEVCFARAEVFKPHSNYGSFFEFAICMSQSSQGISCTPSSSRGILSLEFPIRRLMVV